MDPLREPCKHTLPTLLRALAFNRPLVEISFLRYLAHRIESEGLSPLLVLDLAGAIPPADAGDEEDDPADDPADWWKHGREEE